MADESHRANADEHLHREEHRQEQVHYREEQRHILVKPVGRVLHAEDQRVRHDSGNDENLQTCRRSDLLAQRAEAFGLHIAVERQLRHDGACFEGRGLGLLFLRIEVWLLDVWLRGRVFRHRGRVWLA